MRVVAEEQVVMGDDRELLRWPDGNTSRKPEKWIRKGECNRCGACCEDIDRPHYLVGLLGDDLPEDMEGDPEAEAEAAQGPVSPVVAEHWDGRWVFWRQSEPRDKVCPMWQGDGVCSVYGGEDLPHVCTKWPVFPSEMKEYPTCGFHFVRSGEATE